MRLNDLSLTCVLTSSGLHHQRYILTSSDALHNMMYVSVVMPEHYIIHICLVKHAVYIRYLILTIKNWEHKRTHYMFIIKFGKLLGLLTHVFD